MNPVYVLLVLALIVVVVVAIARLLFDLVTIHDYERGLRYVRGRFVGLLGAGVYAAFRPLMDVRVIDLRPAFLTVEGQEVLTSDGVNLKVSLAARYAVGDPVAAVTADQDYRRATYILLQLALREAMAGRTADDLLVARGELGPLILERSAGPLAKLGLELLSVDVRDLMVPGELKRAFAGVIGARKDGEAALERARGETAALRSLANAARMLEDHPGLVQLRVLQEIGASSGNTVVLGVPETGVVTTRRRPAATAEPAEPS